MDAAGKHSWWWIRNIRNTSTQAQLQIGSRNAILPEFIGSYWIHLDWFVCIFCRPRCDCRVEWNFLHRCVKRCWFNVVRSTNGNLRKQCMHAGHALASAGKRQYATMKRWLSSCDRERPQMITPKATRRNYWYLQCCTWIWLCFAGTGIANGTNDLQVRLQALSITPWAVKLRALRSKLDCAITIQWYSLNAIWSSFLFLNMF